MPKQYKTNLCTFMGRQGNLEILLPYVERALAIDAVDHYYMIDMTRCDSDHEYIANKQKEMNDQFPGRVHLVNHATRKKQLKDGTWKETLGYWKPFYEFCETFNDDDIVIKCDDDTLFFDIETLKAACEFRWNNKSPFLMHANTINNGICAYHQSNKGMWSDTLTKEYPTSGLTGPLFSHPDIACDHHEQFTKDICNDYSNIEKYKLDKNIYFNARVSINFIFMLGKDRALYKDIDSQDEYVISSKVGQAIDRPNMIIGDFVAAHHTYGVQEPVMEERNTLQAYKKLANQCANKNDYTNKDINNSFNKSCTIKLNDMYLMKYWANDNSYTVKNVTTKKYINIEHTLTERVKFVDKKTKVGTGVFWHKSELCASDTGLLFTINIDDIDVMQIQECTEIMKSAPPNDQSKFMSFPVKMWFQQNYNKQKIKFKKKKKNYIIHSANDEAYKLTVSDKGKLFYFFDKDSDTEWYLQSYKKYSNDLILGNIVRDKLDKAENDLTYAIAHERDELPPCNNFREFYWMVDGYIWEEIESKSGHTYRLIADDKQDMYLGIKGSNVCLTNKPHVWIKNNDMLQHKIRKKYLTYNNGGYTLSDTGSKLNISA